MSALDDLARARAVLDELAAWQDTIREAAEGLRFESFQHRLAWSRALPTLPPPPAEQLAFIVNNAHRAGVRIDRNRLGSGKPKPKRKRRPKFTDRQLAIAVAALEAQERKEAA